jgi:hypothetical protein
MIEFLIKRGFGVFLITTSKREKMPAHNKRFGEIGGKVIVRNYAASFDRW